MKINFIGGLPRSGSTLLCNILNQNPKFHATQTSGCMELMTRIKNNWNSIDEHMVAPEASNDEILRSVLKGVLFNYQQNKEVVFNKSRGWHAAIPMLEWVLGEKPKILCPVRDIRDIISSFELLWRKQQHKGQIPGQADNWLQFETLERRINHFSSNDHPIGVSYNRLNEAIRMGFGECLCLVPFEELTNNPEQTMKDIYNFIGEDYFEHDFNNVEQITKEDDRLWGFDNLHKIRKKVEPIEPRYPEVLGDLADQFGDELNFWNKET